MFAIYYKQMDTSSVLINITPPKWIISLILVQYSFLLNLASTAIIALTFKILGLLEHFIAVGPLAPFLPNVIFYNMTGCMQSDLSFGR